MIKHILWRTALWMRRTHGVAPSAPGAASVLSPARIRELDQPTYLRRNLCIAGLGDARRSH